MPHGPRPRLSPTAYGTACFARALDDDGVSLRGGEAVDLHLQPAVGGAGQAGAGPADVGCDGFQGGEGGLVGGVGSRTSSVTSWSQCRVSRVSPRLRWCRCRAVGGGGELRSRGLCRHAASGEDRTIAGARGERLFREECLGRSSCDHLSARLAEWQPTRRSPVAVTGGGEWDGAGVGPDRRTTGRQACARLCHGVPALASAVAFEEAGEAFHSASHEPLGLQPTALNNSRSFGRTPTSP
jgi:hypothetical protein